MTAGGDLFGPAVTRFADGAWLLPGFAMAGSVDLLGAIAVIAATAPFRTMRVPGGGAMSVAMTSAGLGWTSDRRGYRYTAHDPDSDRPWPAIPPVLLALAGRAADAAGYPGFVPDACLVNRYAAGARMGLHQDRDERDMAAPIVSVSLGLPAMFLWTGATRKGPPLRLPLRHGDVVVWGGPSRLGYHGVAPLQAGHDPATGPYRYNLTFRRV